MSVAWQLVVEHRIEKSGGGAYRLKSADGRVDRKVTKREVEELSLHYNIQADNPCSLLTQEAAKKFLHNGNEEDRYRFFLHAANLGSQKQDLMKCQARAASAPLTLAGRLAPPRRRSQHAENIKKRGNVSAGSVEKRDKPALSPMLVGFFIFVVIGSCEYINPRAGCDS